MPVGWLINTCHDEGSLVDSWKNKSPSSNIFDYICVIASLCIVFPFSFIYTTAYATSRTFVPVMCFDFLWSNSSAWMEHQCFYGLYSILNQITLLTMMQCALLFLSSVPDSKTLNRKYCEMLVSSANDIDISSEHHSCQLKFGTEFYSSSAHCSRWTIS